jgi:hypothetical protein
LRCSKICVVSGKFWVAFREIGWRSNLKICLGHTLFSELRSSNLSGIKNSIRPFCSHYCCIEGAFASFINAAKVHKYDTL